jgi:hypothetical protein
MTSMTHGTAEFLLISACIGWGATGALIGRGIVRLERRITNHRKAGQEARYADPGETGQAEDSTAATRSSGTGWPDNA